MTTLFDSSLTYSRFVATSRFTASGNLLALRKNANADTKVMKSSTDATIKVSDLDKEINRVICVFLAIMFCLCVLGAAIIAGGYSSTNVWLESLNIILETREKRKRRETFHSSSSSCFFNHDITYMWIGSH